MNKRTGQSIQSFERLLEDLYKEPEDYPDSVTFMSFEVASEVLTPAKLEIIRTLKNQDIESLSDLAEELDRPLPSISTECKELKNQGLVQIEKQGKIKKPFLARDHLVVLF